MTDRTKSARADLKREIGAFANFINQQSCTVNFRCYLSVVPLFRHLPEV